MRRVLFLCLKIRKQVSKMAKPNLRPDHNGTQRAQFESNKKKIYATQEVCGICGKRSVLPLVYFGKDLVESEYPTV